MNACILHPGPVNGSGYGSVRHGGKRMGAHVRAFILANGPVPHGHVVMHRCHTRQCINPNHLTSDTQSENIKHSIRDARMPQCSATTVCGERHPAARLTEADVRTIKTAQRDYRYGQDSELARRYGVTPKVIRDIRKGIGWTSVALA